ECWCFFFFQAEDGIRVFHVTGVQTCALPISSSCPSRVRKSSTASNPTTCRSSAIFLARSSARCWVSKGRVEGDIRNSTRLASGRSEERRVGKEGRSQVREGQQERKNKAE